MTNKQKERIKSVGLKTEDFEPSNITEDAICELAELIAEQDDAICELAALIGGGNE